MVKGKGSLCSIKPYRQPFDHFFTLKTPWLKVIHDGDNGEKSAETSNRGGGGKNLGRGPRIFPADRTPDEFFTAFFGFGIAVSVYRVLEEFLDHGFNL
jgi:hypothetical protein